MNIPENKKNCDGRETGGREGERRLQRQEGNGLESVEEMASHVAHT